MARQAILAGFPSPVYLNETGTGQAITAGTVYADETISTAAAVYAPFQPWPLLAAVLTSAAIQSFSGFQPLGTIARVIPLMSETPQWIARPRDVVAERFDALPAIPTAVPQTRFQESPHRAALLPIIQQFPALAPSAGAITLPQFQESPSRLAPALGVSVHRFGDLQPRGFVIATGGGFQESPSKLVPMLAASAHRFGDFQPRSLIFPAGGNFQELAARIRAPASAELLRHLSELFPNQPVAVTQVGFQELAAKIHVPISAELLQRISELFPGQPVVVLFGRSFSEFLEIVARLNDQQQFGGTAPIIPVVPQYVPTMLYGELESSILRILNLPEFLASPRFLAFQMPVLTASTTVFVATSAKTVVS